MSQLTSNVWEACCDVVLTGNPGDVIDDGLTTIAADCGRSLDIAYNNHRDYMITSLDNESLVLSQLLQFQSLLYMLFFFLFLNYHDLSLLLSLLSSPGAMVTNNNSYIKILDIMTYTYFTKQSKPISMTVPSYTSHLLYLLLSPLCQFL